MSDRSFSAAARVAELTSAPVPRGIAFQCSDQSALARVVAILGQTWTVSPVEELPGWYEARSQDAIELGEVWRLVREIKATSGVIDAEPLFLIVMPAPPSNAALDHYAASFGLLPIDHWGEDYDDRTKAEIELKSVSHQWHLDQLNVGAAWNRWTQAHNGRVPGDGVVIGHPDTGYTPHTELEHRLISGGRSFIDESAPDGRDDLLSDGDLVPDFPGHGTATSSVIVSEQPGNVFGVAPGAMVLPLRVSHSVIHFDFSNVARAILHAVANNADVISMSLGGPLPSKFVRESIRHAMEQGVIVVSAAGNKLPTTVFPAAYPEVIAAAATHAAGEPWRFSGLGPNVDISAPGEGVWVARSSHEDQIFDRNSQGAGTSFATACIAGLAALWVSFHGGRAALASKLGNKPELIPYAFQFLLTSTANRSHKFVDGGKHGAGIADADELLATELPKQEVVERFRKVVHKQSVHRLSVFTGLLSGVFGMAEAPLYQIQHESALDSRGHVRTGAIENSEAVQLARASTQAEEKVFEDLLGSEWERYADELAARIATDRVLYVALQRSRRGESLIAFYDRLLAPLPHTATPLSPRFRDLIAHRRAQESAHNAKLHAGKLMLPGPVPCARPTGKGPQFPPAPAFRDLRAYSFDPSLATKLTTAPIFQVTIPTRWEDLQPGPVGDYIEVIDIDPASECVYAPVDLDHPYTLAQDGIAPSEGNPQFHQQMVYAVAMNTIHRFELALGRPIFWAPLRPWLSDADRDVVASIAMAGPPARPSQAWRLKRDQYVQRLRIYPHALREANAYYSPSKRALLFGYFPGNDDGQGDVFPGGIVFACLSHDIIAHETTHALLDGMHPFFNEPSNPDVPAFHEAFADVMALFQHFTYQEVLKSQIATTRGDLQTDNLLAQLAQQLGQATGRRGALRNALGEPNKDGVWTRRKPDPLALQSSDEPHDRGSILVAAVFDAFIKLYNNRIADLIRIATSGTGVLPDGQLHPDLVNRLAREAAETAEEVLRICIRSLDYMPPVDITFGEFLRALVTADYELAPTSRRGTRIAFIDAFRSWGIYPRDVQTLSEDSLRWRAPGENLPLRELTLQLLDAERNGDTKPNGDKDKSRYRLKSLVRALQQWEPGRNRREIFAEIVDAQSLLHGLLKELQERHPTTQILPGLDLRKKFSVGNLRPARRVGQQGEFHIEMVVEVVQRFDDDLADDEPFPFRGGATLIFDMRTWEIQYVIYKRLYEKMPTATDSGKSAVRHERQQAYLAELCLGASGSGSAMTGSARAKDWDDAKSNCIERRRSMALAEPFALLHRS